MPRSPAILSRDRIWPSMFPAKACCRTRIRMLRTSAPEHRRARRTIDPGADWESPAKIPTRWINTAGGCSAAWARCWPEARFILLRVPSAVRCGSGNFICKDWRTIHRIARCFERRTLPAGDGTQARPDFRPGIRQGEVRARSDPRPRHQTQRARPSSADIEPRRNWPPEPRRGSFASILLEAVSWATHSRPHFC